MSREVHFVVAVDVDTGTISIDDDTYTTRFSGNEGYWDSEAGEWFPDPEQIHYNKALKILNHKADLESE